MTVPYTQHLEWASMLIATRQSAQQNHEMFTERLNLAFKIAKYMFAEGECKLPPNMSRLPFLLMNSIEIATAFAQLLLDLHSSDNLKFHMKTLRHRMIETLGLFYHTEDKDGGAQRKVAKIGTQMSFGVQRMVCNVCAAVCSDVVQRNLPPGTCKVIMRELSYFCRALAPIFSTPYHLKAWGDGEVLACVLECEVASTCFRNPPEALQMLCTSISRYISREEFPRVCAVAEDALRAARTPSPHIGPVSMAATPPNSNVNFVTAVPVTSRKRRLEV